MHLFVCHVPRDSHVVVVRFVLFATHTTTCTPQPSPSLNPSPSPSLIHSPSLNPSHSLSLSVSVSLSLSLNPSPSHSLTHSLSLTPCLSQSQSLSLSPTQPNTQTNPAKLSLSLSVHPCPSLPLRVGRSRSVAGWHGARARVARSTRATRDLEGTSATDVVAEGSRRKDETWCRTVEGPRTRHATVRIARTFHA